MTLMRTKNDLIAYKRSGEGYPLVLVHGVGANLQSWDEVSSQLEGNFDVIRSDLRGHGQSAHIHSEYSVEKFAADIIQVMDDAGVRKAHLVGFSLGGLIGQELARSYPDRFERVVLLSAVAGRTPAEREKVVARLQMIRDGGMDAIVGAAHDRWFTKDFADRHPDVIDRRIEELKAVHVPSYLEAYRVFGLTELVERLAEIRQPTLVMTGEFDQGSNVRMAETMRRLIPHSELRILAGLKHSILVEAPSLVSEHAREFLLRSR